MTEDVQTWNDGDYLYAQVVIPAAARDQVIGCFTDPDRLLQWWGANLTIDNRVGGAYTVEFPQVGRSITGTIREAAAGEFSFTWDWDHGTPTGHVVVVRTQDDAAAGGAVISVEHGPYRLPDEVAERDGHEEGWKFYLPKLRDHLQAGTG